jgi:hypothetical protein
MFDLYLLPINLINGRENPELNSLWVSAAPRRHERMRAGDLLLILLTFNRVDEISSEETQQLLQSLATTYFRTHGSATTGLRAVAELLNNTLLHENLNKKDGNPISAALNLAVLRKDTLFIAQAGPTHTFILGKNETHDHHDPQMNARSLGLSRTIALRYYQAKLQPGDLFIFCANPPQHWTTDTLANSSAMPLEQLLRRLLYQTGDNLQAVMIQVQTGNGQVKRLKPRSPLASTGENIKFAAQPQPGSPSIASPPITLSETSPEKATAAKPQLQPIVTSPQPKPFTTSHLNPEAPSSASTGIYVPRKHSSAKTDTTSAQTRSPLVSQPAKARPAFRKQLAQVWFTGKRRLSGVRQKIARFLGRLIPEDQNSPMPASTMLFIAIAVPAIIVAIATTVYFQSGPNQQHQMYLEQAKELIIQAGKDNDIVLQRNLLKQADQLLTKAEEFGKSQESIALHQQVQQSLDLMDGVKRIFMQPLITQLDQRFKIKRMVLGNNGDLYALDQTSGQVLRLAKVNQQYKLDEKFICGPGSETDPAMGSVVSIAPIPFSNEFNASVMAVDSNANLLFCVPDDLPLFNPLPIPQTSQVLNATAITVDNGLLYLLDSANNSVWYYTDDITRLKYSKEPHFFFGLTVPEHLTNSIDLAVSGEDLYLLRNDGKMIWCTYAGNQTKCDDPAVLKDMRTGKSGEPIEFSDEKVIQIVTTAPPDPSVYLLNQQSVSIYHFSLKLNLQFILRPQQDDDYFIPNEPPTAFTITPDHQILIAFGYQIFSGALP